MAKVRIGPETEYKVLSALRQLGEATRNDIAHETQLALSTVANALKSLVARKLASSKKSTAPYRRGPSARHYIFKSDAFHVLGIDVRAYTTELTLVKMNGEPSKEKKSIHREAPLSGRSLLRDIIKTIDDFFAEHRIVKEKILCIGLSAPGSHDPIRGTTIVSAGLEWHQLFVCDEIKRHTDIRTFIENNANALALYESRLGAAIGAKDLAAVALGYGIGCGHVINGRIAHGSSGAGVEIGHLHISEDIGICDGCGQKGCLRAGIGGRVFIDRAAKEVERWKHAAKESKDITAQMVIDAAVNDGDENAKKIVADTAKYVGIGIAGVVNLLKVDTVVVATKVQRSEETFEKPLTDEARGRTAPIIGRDIPIHFTPFEEAKFARGAALAALDRIFVPTTLPSPDPECLNKLFSLKGSSARTKK